MTDKKNFCHDKSFSFDVKLVLVSILDPKKLSFPREKLKSHSPAQAGWNKNRRLLNEISGGKREQMKTI